MVNHLLRDKNSCLELLYDGVYYDISNWYHKHPGGDIIKLYASSGEDATHAVQQFHHRSSKRVMAIMKSFPQRLALSKISSDNGNKKTSEETLRYEALTNDFLKLYNEVQEEGLFNPSMSYTFIRCSEIIFFLAISFYLLNGETFSYGQWFLAIFLGGLANGRAAHVAHEGGHFSLTGSLGLDTLIKNVYLGAICGLSADYWMGHHNRHHAGPQHLQYDLYLDTFPVVVFNTAAAKMKPIFNMRLLNFNLVKLNLLIRFQKWAFVPLGTFITVLGWQYFLHPVHVIKQRKWIDLSLMLLYHYIAIFHVGFWSSTAMTYVGAVYVLGNFTISHTHLPVSNGTEHWVEYALHHTTNVRSSWLIDYWMGFLNYQIEHHLFPTMPQFRNPQCSARVKALAKKYDLPYHLCTYKEGAWKSLNNLGDVAHEIMQS